MKSRQVKKSSKSAKRPDWLFAAQAAVIVVGTFIVYLPALRAGFVWDDDLLVVKNPLLQTWSGLGEIWGFGRTADYFPLTNTFFWVQWHLFGNQPLGYHIVNIVLQIADSLLVWLVLSRLRIPGAWLAALLFAIHPVHVSSVVWISELKNVLSMFWALLSVLLFFAYVDTRPTGSLTAYFLSIVSFLLALLSKTQVVFLPIALVLLLWWLDFSPAEAKERQLPSRRTSPKPVAGKPPLLELVPFFILAVVLGLITVAFQSRGIGEEEILLGGIGRRLVNAGMAVWWYIGKLFAPIRLMAIYPNWQFDVPQLVDWLPLLGLGVVVALLWFFRDRGTRGAFVAVAGFIIAVAPVLGFVKMAYARSGTLVADHLQYTADVFLLALIGAGVAWSWGRFQSVGKTAIGVVAATLIATMAAYSWNRTGVYHDEETLWADNLTRNPDAWQAHNRLGQFYFDQGKFAEAAPHFERAAALKPELADNHNQLGLVYARLERFEQGIAEYRLALQLKEKNPATARGSGVATMRTNLANALTVTANNMSEGSSAADPSAHEESMRRYQEAIAEYEKALELEPRHPAIHRNLAIVLARLGRTREAIQHLHRALEIVPNEPVARELLQELERNESSR